MNAAPVVRGNTLAHQLWLPWRLIALNPMITALVFLVVNALFISIGAVVRWIANLITGPGLLLLILLSVVYGLRRVALILSYPGQLELVVRDGEANYARLTRRRLTMFIEATHELVAAVTETGHMANQRMQFLQAWQSFTFSMESVVMPLLQALQDVEREHHLGPNGAVILAVLREFAAFEMKSFSPACTDLKNCCFKEFEAKRQQLFGSGNELIPALHSKLGRVREILDYIDSPAGEARDVQWVVSQLFQSRAKKVEMVTNLDLMRADLAARFHGEQVWINGHANHQVDAMFIPAKTGFSTDKPVMLLCNPNGCLYEFHHLQMDWIRFYTHLNCHVMLFNYRGYGRTKGEPSANLHNLDALAIVNYLRDQRGLKQIGVHGESIGGIVATYLANHCKDISVLVADRTFASLPALAQRLVGGWAGRAVSLLTGWNTDNVTNYLGASCPKLLCSDPCDEIIMDGASLKSGVALRVELGDENCDLPQMDAAQGGPGVATRVPGKGKPRRYSESEIHPQLGAPLTEELVQRFSEAILSIGRRALRYTEQRDRGVHDDEMHISVTVEDDEQQSMLSGDAVGFPQELLAIVWMQLACLDGYCGQCLLQAAENGGHEKIRAWTASLLLWGGIVAAEKRGQRTLTPFERQGIRITPLTILQVQRTLRLQVDRHPAAKFDYDIGFLVSMVDYLVDALQQRWLVLDGTKAAGTEDTSVTRSTSSNAKIGELLALHCGHNHNFLESEREELVVFLHRAGFIKGSESPKSAQRSAVRT
ncbi:TPA: hypothetical protein N0F65_007424 [Lagenidium giganteum]|uniref:AB hydrolase-1 domain-containing protein n=1 Tax=Lagenidium giganteum TaxID=4803 RepID=A0AAV2ZLS3_9STRA|nr:TPA: hypothetical protein N0F65_007424 [Lagenidium giganteum]